MSPLLLNVLDKPVKEAGDKLRQVPLGLMGEVRGGGRWERSSLGRGYGSTYDRFMMMCGRNQCYTEKQLSFN